MIYIYFSSGHALRPIYNHSVWNGDNLVEEVAKYILEIHCNKHILLCSVRYLPDTMFIKYFEKTNMLGNIFSIVVFVLPNCEQMTLQPSSSQVQMYRCCDMLYQQDQT